MLGEFFSWWVEELLSLLPQRLRRTGTAAEDAIVIDPIGPLGRGVDAVAASERRNGRETVLGRFALGAIGLAELPRATGKPVVLRLGEGDVLGKSVSLPIAAQRELDQVLAFEMDRETPFTAEEVYWTYRIAETDRQNGKIGVRLLVLPKAGVAPLLTALAGVGIAPRRAEIGGGADRGCHLPLDGNGGRLDHGSRALTFAAAAAFAVLAIAVVTVPFIRQGIALGAIGRQVAAGQKAAGEADRLREEIHRLTSNVDLIHHERDMAGHPLEVLAAATRVLPDNTYLTEFELRNRKVTLSGRSAAAARLIEALAASGTPFRNPAFAAPVTRIEALHTEIFTIAAEVKP